MGSIDCGRWNTGEDNTDEGPVSRPAPVAPRPVALRHSRPRPRLPPVFSGVSRRRPSPAQPAPAPASQRSRRSAKATPAAPRPGTGTGGGGGAGARPRDGTLNLSGGTAPPRSLSPVLDTRRGAGLETVGTQFRATRPLTWEELDALYGDDGIGRAIIDLPVEAAFADWCTIDVDPGWEDVRDEVVALAARLDVAGRYQEAERRSSIDGSAALVLGYEDGRFDTVAAAGYVTPIWLRTAWGRDVNVRSLFGPESPRYGEAAWISVARILPDVPSDFGFSSRIGTVHGSRFVRLHTPTGRSDYQTVALYLANLLAGGDGTGSMLQRAALGVFKIKDWKSKIWAKGQSVYDVLQAQFAMINANRAVVLDEASEDFQLVSNTGLSGAESAVYALSWLLAAAARIPMTRLYGMSPSGFSSGASERRDWADRARNRRTKAEPAIRWVYDRLFAEVLGEPRVPNYRLIWPALDAPTTEERFAAASSALDAAEKAIGLRVTTAQAVVAGFSATPELDLFTWEEPAEEVEAEAAEMAASYPLDLEDPKVLAGELAVKPSTLAGMAERGEVSRWKVGKRWRYSRAQVAEAVLRASSTDPAALAAGPEEGARLDPTDPPGRPGPDGDGER